MLAVNLEELSLAHPIDSDEPEMESNQHLVQMILLINSLKRYWRDRQDFFVAGNLSIYYSHRQLKSEDWRGPDFFVVLDTAPNPLRRSWVVWQEGGKYPNVIVELLSPSTAHIDRGTKKLIYQNIFRTPEYFLFDPINAVLEGFALHNGSYIPMAPNAQGRLWSEQLQLYLGVLDLPLPQLRFFAPDGELVPTPEEAEQKERQLRKSAETRIQQEQELRRSAEAKIAELEAEIERLAGEHG